MEDLKFLTQAVGELDETAVIKKLVEFVSCSPSPSQAQAVMDACQQGMGIVGDLFEKNEYFVGDLIFAGELLTKAVEMLKPVLGDKSSSSIGKMVLGTVQGDLHDIGKNIFKSMAEASGFEVYDLGIDQPAEAFVQRVREVQPDVVGMSGLLGLSVDAMKETIAGLEEASLRDNVKIILGGQAVTKEICEKCGADAFTTNAQEGVKICLGWVR